MVLFGRRALPLCRAAGFACAPIASVVYVIDWGVLLRASVPVGRVAFSRVDRGALPYESSVLPAFPHRVGPSAVFVPSCVRPVLVLPGVGEFFGG